MVELRGSSGDEARRAVEEVLLDQSERKERREDVSDVPRGPKRLAGIAVVVLSALTGWAWAFPPPLFRPPPLPPPSVETVQAGLHMDVFVAAAQVQSFRERTGQLPGSLAEALAEPGQADGLTYRTTGARIFEIIGVRGEEVVVYRSTQPLEEFARTAPEVLRGGVGGREGGRSQTARRPATRKGPGGSKDDRRAPGGSCQTLLERSRWD